jgi:hypothetical protein
MKWMILYCFGLCFFGTCETATSPQQATAPVKNGDTAMISFQKEIEPILVRRCSPCHFTGGVMYLRMPFDKDSSILQHPDGILKRIKDEKEKSRLQKFIDQQKRP